MNPAQPKTNEPEYLTPTGGNPQKASNAFLMKGTNKLDYYSGGKCLKTAVANALQNAKTAPSGPPPPTVQPPPVAPAVNTVQQNPARTYVQGLVAKMQQSPVKPTAPQTKTTSPIGAKTAQDRNVDDLACKDELRDYIAEDPSRFAEQLNKGIAVEYEHTSDIDEAVRIALDHIAEKRDYYDKLEDAGLADELKKTADAVKLMPRKEYISFTPDGKVVVKPLDGRRYDFPTTGAGKPAPYEGGMLFVPPTGVPEAGYHGYDVGFNVGEAANVPEGFSAVDPEEALKNLYASMGLSANKPYRELDRARARVILRHLKKLRKAKDAQTQAAPLGQNTFSTSGAQQ